MRKGERAIDRSQVKLVNAEKKGTFLIFYKPELIVEPRGFFKLKEQVF